MFKRTISILLVLITLSSLVPLQALAASTNDYAPEEYTIYDGVAKTVTIAGDGTNAAYIFVPEYSDTYIFTSNSTGDTIGAIYDHTGNTQLAYNDDSGTGNNFQISYYMSAGAAYILTTRFYTSSKSGSYTISITGTHTHIYGEATCSTLATCTICGATTGTVEPDNHNFITENCLSEMVCSYCHQGNGIIPGHIYDYDCDADCNVCGEIREASHNWIGATCTVAPTCDICGTTGEALGHTYTDVCDDTCDRCSEVRTAPHSYKTIVQKATTTADGYTIEQCELCNHQTNQQTVYKASKITLSKTSYTYNGKTQKPKVVVKDSQGNTISSSNYTVTYSSGCKKAGTYKVTVKFKGNYSGSKTLTYTIKRQTASKVTVKLSKTTFAYNKKVQTPTLTLKDTNGNTLKNKTDYTITYPSGRKNVGTYKIVIKFKGNYSGSKTVTYTISPTTKKELKGYIGDTLKIGAKSNTKITYSSSNKKVATVNSKGVITALKSGTVTITVKSGKVTQKITVKVTAPTIKVKAKKSSMYIGQSQKMTATYAPSGGKITWSVNNKKLAKISSSGKLTALGKGTVTVTAKLTYKGKTYKSSCKVKIDVEYPDISVFISSQSKYTDTYAMIIQNNSNRTLKVLNQGYISCGGYRGNIKSLYANSGGYNGFYKSINIAGGSSRTMVSTLDRKLLFLSSDTVYAYYYVEYGGELFRLSCSTNRYGINKCHTITWIMDS